MALKIGDKVSTSASVDVNGTHLASFVRNNVYEIIQIGGQNYPDNYVVLGCLVEYLFYGSNDSVLSRFLIEK